VHDDVEADDIIGQFAEIAQRQSHPVTIISADKDLAQFIRQADCYWNFAKNTRSSFQQLHKRFGVRPQHIADLLALCGDKVDNIPGVPGVGAATAARVLTKWGNLDGVFANLDGVAAMRFRGAPHVAVLLREYESTVRFARQLTGLIYCDALPTQLDAIAYCLPEQQSAIEGLCQAGFNSTDATQFAQRICRPLVTG